MRDCAHNDLTELERALEVWDPRYDPDECMVRQPFSSPGYHTVYTGPTVHPTRSSLEYALALLDSGDPERLAPHLRQLVLNPCEGHRKKDRSIHESHFFETLRESAALDGAFVVNRRGVVESAGTYLAAPATKRTKLFSGLGAGHASAAAITAETECSVDGVVMPPRLDRPDSGCATRLRW